LTVTYSRKSLEPWVKDEVEYYPHQIDGIRTLARRRSFLLGDDMGLGKSLQALTIFAIDVYRGWAQTMLVVCPVTLKGNWADEIEKFTRIPYTVLEGEPIERLKQILEFRTADGPRILIVNYEQITAHQEQLDRIRFDVACFDEAHYLQNHKAKRTEAALDVYSRRSFLLTGTPMLNHVNGLWPLLHRIDPQQFPEYFRFVNRYAVFGGYKNKQIIGVKNEKQLTEKLQNLMLRRLKKDVLNLPVVQMIDRRVDLTEEQQALYDEVLNEMRLPRIGQETPDDIDNALTKFLRLKQICGTTLPFTGEDHSSKLDLAIEDDLELVVENGHRTVVFTQFRPMLQAYVDRMARDKMGKDVPVFQLHGDVPKPDRVQIVKQWGSTRDPGIIVCGLQVASEGLNLVAARHAAFLDQLFTPGKNQQAIDRLHRIGASETQPVQIRRYIARNTIESRIEQILRIKTKLFGEIVESDPDWKRKLYRLLMEEESS
jgi:SNF2 family DNA or RNA helicase